MAAQPTRFRPFRLAAAASVAVCGAAAAAAEPAPGGGLSLGPATDGVPAEAFVAAPPSTAYVLERRPGDFLDCGAGQEARTADANGRDRIALTCGVTLVETLAVPAAAQSARLVVHF